MVYLLLFILFFCSCIGYAQDSAYTSPVKIPLFLSGSFAELRSNHFHSGMDIKTGGVTGLPVYAVADGHISRIVVSPTGFGLALYVDHPQGTTSVYGHLDNFREDIGRYIKSLQYNRKSFSLDVPIPDDLFPLKKGELIAKSGNSGSSGGPHLHFELRDTQTEEPVNPLHYSFPVVDKTPPRLYSVMIVPLHEYAHVNYQPEKIALPVVENNGKYVLKNDSLIPVYGMTGFAISTNDFFDGSNNRCGVYSIRMFWDGELYYSFRMDRFSFDESRYINSHIDFEEYMQSQSRFHKAWIDPGNRLGIYDYVRNNGIVRVTDGNIHHVRFVIADLAGNTSTLDFQVVSKVSQVERKIKPYNKLLKYNAPGSFIAENIRIDFPENCFYSDVPFVWRFLPSSEKFLSDVHVVHKNTVPLHHSARLSIQTANVEKRLHDKVLLVRVDTLTGKITGMGGSYANGWVTGQIRSFGNYSVAVDSIPPRILPLSIKDKSALTESSRIRFQIADDLSGIKDFTGIIDGEWALFEYDAKTGVLVHYFDSERFTFGKRHSLHVTITDNQGNASLYEASFWK
ncbi:MAG: M23 family metallopeptidase [Mariniphaga sp.]